MTLAEKVAEFPAEMPDWAVADALNEPDPALPPVLTRNPTKVGPGTIMATLGATAGATFLDTLTALSATSSPIKWALKIIDRGELDLSADATRTQIDALASAGVLTAPQAAALKALGETSRYPSWAEHNNIPVDARAVGLARGGQ